MKIGEYEQMMAYLTRPEPQPIIKRDNFAFGTEKPITQTNDLGNIQVADLKDDLTPGPLKDELDGKYDPSQETYEEYLQRINLERPFNASLEESTTGPGGYPMTAGNILNVPKAAKTAVNLFEKGQVGIRDAIKITKDFLNRREIHKPTGLAGDKKDYTKEKDFLQVFNKLKNKFFQGDTTKTNRALGVYERLAKDMERRVIQSEKGTGVKGQDDRFLFYEPAVPEPSKGMSWPETTTSMKKNPNKFLSLKVEKENPNRFLDKKSLANYLGIKFEKDDAGKLTRFGKTQSDAFMTRLTNLDVKKTNQGLFDTNDAINKLVKVSEQKLVKGERKSQMGAGRNVLDKKFDPELSSIREMVKNRIEKRSKGVDAYLPNAVDDLGHPYSLTNSEEKYKKLFKDSNINGLNTLVYQDPLINRELFKNSGYESKHDKMFDALSKIQNKKVTPEVQKQLLQIKNDLNQNYNYVKNIIKNPKELSRYLPENTPSDYVNYLSKSHLNRIQKIDINVPEVGETFKSENVFVDMSRVDPRYIMGYVDLINPTAKKIKDLSPLEKEQYKNNLMSQNSEIVSEFLDKANFPKESVKEVKEEVSMDFAEGGRAKFNEGALAKIGNVAGKTFAGIDAPIIQALLASGYQAGDDPFFYTLPAAFTETVNKYLNLYEKSPGKAKNFMKSALRLMPIKQAQKFYPVFSKLGKIGSTTGYPFLKAASEALKEIKVRGETERAAADFKMSPQKMKELRSKSIIANLPEIKDDAYVPTQQDYSEADEKIQKAKDAFALQAKIMGSVLGLTEDPLAEKESIYTRGQQVPMSLERVQQSGRSNFEDGTDPKKPKGLASLSKRNFLKTLALIPAGIMAIRGGPNLLKKAKPAVEAIKNAPPHFMGLVNKIRALGRLVDPKKLMPSDQKRYSNVYDYGEYRMFEKPDGGIEISKEKLMDTEYGDAKVSEEYMSYNPKVPKYNKKGEIIPDEFESQYDEYTAYADQEGKMKDVVDGVEPSTIDEGTYSKEELEQLIIEQVEQNLKKGKK